MPRRNGRFAYVGSFTTERRRARGSGLDVYAVDPATGGWTHLQHLGPIDNPSFLLLNGAGTRLYSVHGDLDHASSYTVDRETGRIAALNRAATGGENGVSLALSPDERFLVVANYTGGNVAVLPVAGDGSLGDQMQLLALPGQPRPMHRSGHHQSGSHPHDVVFDPSGRWVAVPDKGLDRIFLFAWDAQAGRLVPADPDHADGRDGVGPRHLAFHPRRPLAWVLNEMDSTVATCRWDGAHGHLEPFDVISTLPGEFTGDTSTAEIAYHPTTRTLYASNRGHDSITVFRVARDTGVPRPVAWVPTLGAGPRFFRIDPAGRFLYVANETGDNIVPFAIDPRTGALSQAHPPITSPSACTIVFS